MTPIIFLLLSFVLNNSYQRRHSKLITSTVMFHGTPCIRILSRLHRDIVPQGKYKTINPNLVKLFLTI